MSELDNRDRSSSTEKMYKSLSMDRVFTTEGVHPYDDVEWVRRDVVMTNWRDGSVNFEQKGVEFPDFWSLNAINIVTTKYFRGTVGTENREYSLRQIIDRVVGTYSKAAWENGYISEPKDVEIFEQELTWMLLHQVFAFNSPVWFNVGTDAPAQISACFLLAVEDDMESILNWYKEEGLIFKGGSGSGVNLSKIRSSKELLRGGGTASGPVSFMRGADSSAGAIKSGGKTRRAAKMVVLDVDHPDIEEFVWIKAREEKKIRALRDAGFDMDLGGADIASVQFQNANNSVRVSDEFMQAVEDGRSFGLTARTTGEIVENVDARKLFHDIAQSAWECADPGIQYDGTIQDWHTTPESGRIETSNPCSEYLSVSNSSCNLSSINLMKFLKEDGTFDTETFSKVVEYVITAMEISVSFGSFPTEKITEITHQFRQLGIGVTNLGALLMASGLPYDSPEGRSVAAGIHSLMTAVAYRRSAEIAGVLGSYDAYDRNAKWHTRVMNKHKAANEVERRFSISEKIFDVAATEWEECLEIGERNGWRNAQISLAAPTGTISFYMDADTTGIEPEFALVKHKKLVGGGSMKIVNQTVPLALRKLGYQEEQVEAIVEYIAEHGHVIDAPGLKQTDYPVFDCALGERAISPMGHIRLMAAIQPYLSGAQSKTVNVPESATVEEIEEIYFQGWKMGLKALAIYRDNCKVGQPLSTQSAKSTEKEIETPHPRRHRLPKVRPATTVRFSVGGAEGYLTEGYYSKDKTELGEVFIKMSKQGSTLAGVMDALSIAVSIGLQYGVPLEAFISKFVNTRFEPAGMTDDQEIRMATSLLDYIGRRLALDAMETEDREILGILTTEERTKRLEEDYGDPAESEEAPTALLGVVLPDDKRVAELSVKDTPMCLDCGIGMRQAGSCYVCESCGTTSGCS